MVEFFIRQLKHEIPGKSLGISFHGLFQCPGLDTVKHGKIAVEDFGDAIDHLRGHRVAFHMEPFETPVCRMVFILDPDGNALYIHQRKPRHG